MEFTITLSLRRILESVYAASAMRTFVAKGDNRPEMLTADNTPLMKILALDTISLMALDLAPWLSDVDIPIDADTEMAVLNFRTDGGGSMTASAVRRCIEGAVVERLTAAVFCESDEHFAKQLRERSNETLKSVCRLLDGPKADDLHLRPYF